MDKKKLAILVFLFLLLIVMVFVFFRSNGKEKVKSTPEAPPADSQPRSQEPEKTRTVALFFLAEEDSLLHPEEREISSRPSVVEEAKEVIEELIKGPKNDLISPLPPETKLRQVFISKEGMAYVDFSKEIMEKHPSGSSAELFTVYCVVNSLAYNFNTVKKVFILVEGAERETLDGHIDLSKPFLPDYSMVAK
jgi:germination protein M